MSNELCVHPGPRQEFPRPGSRRQPCSAARPAVLAALIVLPALGAPFLTPSLAAAPPSVPVLARRPAPALAAAARSTPAATATPKAAPGAGQAAAEPWDGRFFTAPPAELLAAAALSTAAQTKADEDMPASVLFAEDLYSFDDAGRLSRTHRLVYRLRNATDASWSQIGVSWLPWHQQTPRLRARVVTPDGQEHRLDPALLERSTVGSDDAETFAERQQLRGPLPATGPGAVIEEEETVVDAAPLFDRGTFERHAVGMGVPVRHLRVVIEAPAAMNLRYAVEVLPGLTPRRETVAGRQRLVFERRDMAPVPRPPAGLPPEAPRWPAIAFSNAASWSDIAESYSRIVDRAAAGAALEPWLAAAHAHDPAESQIEVIGRVLAHMTDIRYTAVELGEGGIVPRPPAATIGRRFGDCKDKAVLLATALRALDVPAYVALLASGQGDRDVIPELPGFGAFDHAIVYVPGTPALWIDPTDPFARAGELPMSDQGRYALVAAPGITGLTRTPLTGAADNRVQKTREFFLADAGPARVVETIAYTGAAERRERAYLIDLEASALRKDVDEYAKDAFSARAAATFENSDPRDLARPLSRRLVVPSAGRGYTDPATAVVAVFYSSLFDLLPDDLTTDDAAKAARSEDGDDVRDTRPRQDDFWFRLPHTVEVRYRVVPPDGYQPEDLPASRVRRLGTATLTEEFATGEHGMVTASLRFETGRQRISAAEYTALHVSLVELAQEKPLLLRFRQVGEAMAAAGRTREALVEFRRESAAAPAKALPHQRIAMALLAGGLGEAARQEAERAVALEPRAAEAWSTLGWVLQHDAIGRRFGPGFPRQRALAAYVKAKQLASDLTTARLDYAILLEHNEQGDRYGQGADLPAAIAEYRALRKAGGDFDADDNLLVDLLYAGRPAEALELAGTMKASESKPSVVAAATALKDGAPAAVHEVERTTTEPSKRWPILASAAQTLVHLGAVATAGELLEQGAPMSPNASEMLTRAAILRQVRRLDQIPLPASDPASVAKRLFITYAAKDADDASFLALFADNVRRTVDQPRSGKTHQLAEIQREFRRQVSSSGGLPPDVSVAIAMAAMKQTVTGDDTLGHRIDLRMTMVDVDMQFFVVHEGAGYRIAAISTEPGLLGVEAQRRLAAGDLRGATQWLDWAREITAEPTGDPPVQPFSRLWTRGVAAGADQARCAAAALAVTVDTAASLPVLHTCRTAETTEDRQVALDVALVRGAAAGKQWGEVREAAERLGKERPAAELPFLLEAGALRELGGPDAVIDLAKQRLARLPADRLAQLVLAETAASRGDFDTAERGLRQLVAAPAAETEELNDLAWLLLVRGRADQDAIELAQRAVQHADGKTHTVLHTLAALLAESNRPGEAYQTMVQALASEDDRLPESADWYVFGRMAEQYGLPDVARGLYARVERPARDNADSSWRLARARLAAIDGKPAPRAAVAGTAGAAGPRAE